MSECIEIRRLRAKTRIGVTEEERADPQEVEISVRMTPKAPLKALGDALENTVDYYAVSRRILEIALCGERQLIETLAEEIAETVLDGFAVRRVAIEVRKFVLPEAEWVAVRLKRKA